jgi:hypothetical protein
VIDGQLSGRVQDSAGVTLAGAEVGLAEPGTLTPVARTTTDAKGAYALVVPKGTYDAIVTAPGVGGTTLEGRRQRITVGANSKLTVVLLRPPGTQVTFTGVVRDADGLPLSGVILGMATNLTRLPSPVPTAGSPWPGRRAATTSVSAATPARTHPDAASPPTGAST